MCKVFFVGSTKLMNEFVDDLVMSTGATKKQLFCRKKSHC